MDIAIVERLIPHLAWPVTVLIALPFLVWRLGAVAKLHDILSGDKLSGLLAKVVDLEERLTSVQNLVMELEQNRLWDQVAKLPPEIANLEPAIQDNRMAAALTPQQMYEEANRKWGELENLIESKLQRLGKQYDRRSVVVPLSVLRDGRRRTPLSEEGAELISELHSILKSFRRLRGSKEDWLTADVYERFVSSVEQAKLALEGVE